MTGIIAIALFLLFLSHLRLRDRVSELETKRNEAVVSKVEEGIVKRTPPPLAIESLSLTPPSALSTFSPRMEADTESTPWTESVVWRWLKEYTLIKIGATFFFLGMGWFVSYAIREGWLLPELRILLGLLTAVTIVLLARMRQADHREQYLLLTVLAVGIWCATVLAAQEIFSLFPISFALMLVAVAVSYAGAVAWYEREQALMVVTTILAFVAPLIAGAAAAPLLTLPYLFVVATGVVFVALRFAWRSLLVLLAVGTWVYLHLFMGIATPLVLWIAALGFSALLCAGVTMLVLHVRPLAWQEAFTIATIGVMYAVVSVTALEDASIALFMAALVCGFIGYVLASRRVGDKAVALYAGACAAFILLGTGQLFSGYSLVLAYLVEVTSAFFVVTYLSLPSPVVWWTAAAYLLPIFGSLPAFVSDQWLEGVWHAEAVALYALFCSLAASSWWLIHRPGVAAFQGSRFLAGLFGTTAFVYAYAIVATVVAAMLEGPATTVLTYVLWAIVTLLTVFYSVKAGLPLFVTRVASLTFFLPLFLSVSSLSSRAWQIGVYHVDGFGVGMILLLLVLLILFLTQVYCREYDAGVRGLIGWFLVVGAVHLGLAIQVFWGSLFPSSLATVAVYITYATILYGMISLFVLLQVRVSWVRRTSVLFLLPLLLSLQSFAPLGWTPGPLSPDAVGFGSIIILLILSALGFRRHVYGERGERASLLVISRVALAAALMWSVLYVWSLTHSLVLPTEAVSLALFIYTVSGLGAYLYGVRRGARDVRYVGIVLLALVVARLVIIDMHNMEQIWKIVTFLGVGALFIAAALLERNAKSR